jgi:hypothetical protein
MAQNKNLFVAVCCSAPGVLAMGGAARLGVNSQPGASLSTPRAASTRFRPFESSFTERPGDHIDMPRRTRPRMQQSRENIYLNDHCDVCYRATQKPN